MKLKYSPTRRFGNKAEDLAVSFLVNTGYTILTRNFLRKVGEIDIIALKDGIYHFIEVKGVTYETPYDVLHETSSDFNVENRVGKKKIHKICKTARHFLLDNEITDAELQVDMLVVAFYKNGDIPRIDLLENLLL